MENKTQHTEIRTRELEIIQLNLFRVNISLVFSAIWSNAKITFYNPMPTKITFLVLQL